MISREHRIGIIRTGSTFDSLMLSCGDFSDWIVAGMNTDKPIIHIDAVSAASLPDPSTFYALVITGSEDMVTDHLPWSERLSAWLRDAVYQGVHILGICYGHQLLAYSLGGVVGDNPKGSEYGTTSITLLGAAANDPLLEGLPPIFLAPVNHHQSVLQLPAGAVSLGYSAKDSAQVVRYSPTAWGVQFHPEFDAEICRRYLEQDRALILNEGQDPGALLAAVSPTPYAASLLKRFSDLVE